MLLIFSGSRTIFVVTAELRNPAILSRAQDFHDDIHIVVGTISLLIEGMWRLFKMKEIYQGYNAGGGSPEKISSPHFFIFLR